MDRHRHVLHGVKAAVEHVEGIEIENDRRQDGVANGFDGFRGRILRRCGALVHHRALDVVDRKPILIRIEDDKDAG